MATDSGPMVRLWDTLADSYDQVGVDFFAPIAAGLVDALDPRPGERAVDLGCGRGAALLDDRAAGRALGGGSRRGPVRTDGAGVRRPRSRARAWPR